MFLSPHINELRTKQVTKKIHHMFLKMLEIKDLEPIVAQATLAQGMRKGPIRYALGF